MESCRDTCRNKIKTESINKHELTQLLSPMYNDPLVNVTDRLFVTVVHYQCITYFLISLFELKLDLYSVYLS